MAFPFWSRFWAIFSDLLEVEKLKKEAHFQPKIPTETFRESGEGF